MSEIKRFAGIKNTTSPERLKAGELTDAQDVDIDNTGRILSRRGTTRVSATPLHSLYSNHRVAIAVSGNTLVAIEPNFSLTPLVTLSSSAKLSAETVLDTIYYSNGVDTGRIIGKTPATWGVTPPIGQPVATQVPGNLPPGRYRYAVTFQRSDGHESGTGVSGQIDITLGGIALSSIPVSTNTDVVNNVIYMTGANGEVLFNVATIPNAQTTYVYSSNGLDLGIPLITQFITPPPPGTLVRSYNGILYVVVGDAVYYSSPYGLEWFSLDTDFFRFPGRIVMFEPVNDGIYVATPDAGGDDSESSGSIWFLSGSRPDKMQSIQLFDYGIVENTAVHTDAAYFDKEVQGEDPAESSKPIIVWTSRHGICAGKDGGDVTNLTETKYSFSTAQRGAAFVRQDRGYTSYIVTLQGPGVQTNEYVETV